MGWLPSITWNSSSLAFRLRLIVITDSLVYGISVSSPVGSVFLECSDSEGELNDQKLDLQKGMLRSGLANKKELNSGNEPKV